MSAKEEEKAQEDDLNTNDQPIKESTITRKKSSDSFDFEKSFSI